jgi:hypothetical protein
MVPFELVVPFFYNGEDAITGRGGNSFAETGGFTLGYSALPAPVSVCSGYLWRRKYFLIKGKTVKNQEISGDLFEWQMQSSLNMREHGRGLLPGSTSMGGRVYRSWIRGKTFKGSISSILNRT